MSGRWCEKCKNRNFFFFTGMSKNKQVQHSPYKKSTFNHQRLSGEQEGKTGKLWTTSKNRKGASDINRWPTAKPCPKPVCLHKHKQIKQRLIKTQISQWDAKEGTEICLLGFRLFKLLHVPARSSDKDDVERTVGTHLLPTLYCRVNW